MFEKLLREVQVGAGAVEDGADDADEGAPGVSVNARDGGDAEINAAFAEVLPREGAGNEHGELALVHLRLGNRVGHAAGQGLVADEAGEHVERPDGGGAVDADIGDVVAAVFVFAKDVAAGGGQQAVGKIGVVVVPKNYVLSARPEPGGEGFAIGEILRNLVFADEGAIVDETR